MNIMGNALPRAVCLSKSLILCSMDKGTILNVLKKAKPVLYKEFGVQELALFGSYARDSATSGSDIDILIALETPSYRNLCNAAYMLYDLFPGYKVQVVSKKGVKPGYFQVLEKDLIFA